MDLDLRGHPLHSRALCVALRRREDGDTDVVASILDLRKGSFVPVAGDLQGSGVIHHMQIAAVVARETLELRSVEVAQPSVAFEPSALTGGESCRDPAHRLQALVGRRLDSDFASRLSAQIGGPRGCTHVLTLAQLLGSSVARARECELRDGPGHAPGERIFRRDLVFDGSRVEGSRIALAAQLTDLHFRPAPPVAQPLERLGEELELRLRASVDVVPMRLELLEACERRRGVPELEQELEQEQQGAAWRDLGPELAGLAGLSVGPGVSGRLLRHLAGQPDHRPLLDVLLNLTPACYQCLANFDEAWPAREARSPSLLGMGGLPDSCYMWRAGGALDRLRDPSGTPRPRSPR